MYSSVLGGIVLDPALMSVPLDDHMVHRGHAVFDTALLVDGHLYELEHHFQRFLYSARLALLDLPSSAAQLMRIVLDTVAASCQRDGVGQRNVVCA